MIYVGVDPGKSGGLVAIDAARRATGRIMPVSGGEVDTHTIGAWLWGLVLQHDSQVTVCVEKVHAMPKQGVSSTFTFGVGYGKVLGVVGALGIRCELVTPQAWKASVLAGSLKDKAAAIAWATRAYPALALVQPGCRVPHDGVADALCIAEFARRTYS